jgi:hypothetical protein
MAEPGEVRAIFWTGTLERRLSSMRPASSVSFRMKELRESRCQRPKNG